MERVSKPGGPGKTAYRFQHVLVMEHHLGRRLQCGETVHHINGAKDDNRIGNLELWVKSHPAGIRATDALTWARSIIEIYEHA